MDKVLKTLKKVLKNIYWLVRSLFWKRDNRTVLFGSWFGLRFADNPRFLYQYLTKNKVALGLKHVVWVSRDQTIVNQLNEYGYEAYMMDSDEGLHFLKTTAYHLICNSDSDLSLSIKDNKKKIVHGDIDGIYSFGAKRINLWHGTGGMKSVGFLSNEYRNARKKNPVLYSAREFFLYHCKTLGKLILKPGGWGVCYQIVTSPEQSRIMNESYGTQKEMCIETSYPRNCVCPELFPEEKKVLDLMKSYNRVFLYLPTFRNTSAVHKEKIGDSIKDVLKKHNILWIEKSHSAEVFDKTENVFKDNAIYLNPLFDINTILPDSDVLVTDYSSARMDAIYLNKPVFFFVTDYEEYVKGNNGLNAGLEEFVCGPLCTNIDELGQAINEYIKDPSASKKDNYSAIRNKYWSKHRELGQIWQDILDTVNK